MAMALDLNALNLGASYFVTVDAINDSDITPGSQPVSMP
jgi:hypothetical protein